MTLSKVRGKIRRALGAGTLAAYLAFSNSQPSLAQASQNIRENATKIVSVRPYIGNQNGPKEWDLCETDGMYIETSDGKSNFQFSAKNISLEQLASFINSDNVAQREFARLNLQYYLKQIIPNVNRDIGILRNDLGSLALTLSFDAVKKAKKGEGLIKYIRDFFSLPWWTALPMEMEKIPINPKWHAGIIVNSKIIALEEFYRDLELKLQDGLDYNEAQEILTNPLLSENPETLMRFIRTVNITNEPDFLTSTRDLKEYRNIRQTYEKDMQLSEEGKEKLRALLSRIRLRIFNSGEGMAFLKEYEETQNAMWSRPLCGNISDLLDPTAPPFSDRELVLMRPPIQIVQTPTSQAQMNVPRNKRWYEEALDILAQNPQIALSLVDMLDKNRNGSSSDEYATALPYYIGNNEYKIFWFKRDKFGNKSIEELARENLQSGNSAWLDSNSDRVTSYRLNNDPNTPEGQREYTQMMLNLQRQIGSQRGAQDALRALGLNLLLGGLY